MVTTESSQSTVTIINKQNISTKFEEETWTMCEDSAYAVKTVGYSPIYVLTGGVAIVTVVFVLVIVGYVGITRARIRRERKKSRLCSRDEEGRFYRQISPSSMVDSRETLVNPPIPLTPLVQTKTEGNEADAYETPIQPFWSERSNEIKNLPPAPPVFHPELANLSIEGEGSYLIVLPDSDPPLYPKMKQELMENLYEKYDEKDYLEPIKYKKQVAQCSKNDYESLLLSSSNNSKKCTEFAEIRIEGKNEKSESLTTQQGKNNSENVNIAAESVSWKRSEEQPVFRSVVQIQLSPPTPQNTSSSRSKVVVSVSVDGPITEIRTSQS